MGAVHQCPRLSGPDLLNIAADFADIETIRILAASEHLKIHGDEGYVLAAKSSDIIKNRPDVSEDLIVAFEELLSLMSDEHSEMGEEGLLESGLLSGIPSSLSDDGSNLIMFEDALETLETEA